MRYIFFIDFLPSCALFLGKHRTQPIIDFLGVSRKIEKDDRAVSFLRQLVFGSKGVRKRPWNR
jgi:hypothetical protein